MSERRFPRLHHVLIAAAALVTAVALAANYYLW
jgi:hypothetical protein